ncbi:hypothetical protein ACROYT_G012973 [Oculina patagonica]
MVSEYAGDPSEWAETIIFVLVFIFTLYSPAIICLFSASEVTRQGVRQIIVEGPSPVGFRRLIGNCFFSTENTFWHRTRKFIMRVILLPILFLVPAMYVEYLLFQNALSQETSVKETTILLRPFMMVCCGCYFIQAFIFHFIIQISDHAQFCVTNKKSITCTQRELPERMLNHMRFICKILIRMWTMSWLFMLKNVKYCIRTCPSFVISLLFFYKFVWFIIQLLAIILLGLLIILLTGLLTVLLLGLSCPAGLLCFYATTSELWKIVNINFLHHRLLFAVRLVVVLLDTCMFPFSLIAVVLVLRSAAVGIIIFPQFAVAFSLFEENLPFVLCCVLASFYLWSDYRSFTRKYKDLAVKLLEKHDSLAHRNPDTELNMQWVFPEKGCALETMKRIPKELFDLACEEIMPVRETICETLFKAYLCVTLVFLIYLLKLPFSFRLQITAISICLYSERKTQEYLKSVVINEKADHIVQKYIKNRVPRNSNRAGKGPVSSELQKYKNDDVILTILCETFKYFYVCYIIGFVFGIRF